MQCLIAEKDYIYAVLGHLVGDLHLSTLRSAIIVANFMGTLNLLALLGGFLADAKLGRYMTVAIFATITAASVSLLTIDTSVSSSRPPACGSARVAHHECVVASDDHLAMLYVSHHTIALGAGGIKANGSQPRPQGGEGHDLLLEPLLLLHQPRFAVRGHGAGVRPGQRQPGVGLRHLDHHHGGVAAGHGAIPVQEAAGEPGDDDVEGVPLGLGEAEVASSSRSQRPNRVHHGQGRAHRMVQIITGERGIFAMVVSAVVERKRRNLSVHHDTKMSVFRLVPQLFLVGAGVAFA
ncbi:hypothetical protein BHE74_00023152 [Ensete ventricosum]|nr:hypothetical protein BHE74_00023152 [Ensete ventricosum]